MYADQSFQPLWPWPPSVPLADAEAKALGVHLYACEMAMHVLGLQADDFVHEVEDVLGVATFLRLSEGGQTLFV